MTASVIHEDPAPGWGISHYHGAVRTEGDHCATVTILKPLRSAELVVALDHEREKGWRLVAVEPDGQCCRYVLERVRE